MSNCDTWDGARTSGGYGWLRVAGVQIYAHRLTWMQDNGHTDLHILHSCDNPSCVNVAHLREGTRRDNMRDMYARNRYPGVSPDTCPMGHEYTPANTYTGPDGRRCRRCRRERWK